MKLAIFLLMAVSAWGQQTQPVGVMQNKTSVPLQCGKYQHVESPAPMCGDSVYFGPDGKLVSSCFAPYCVDDMHLVTEREWQELMERLSKLEKAGKHD